MYLRRGLMLAVVVAVAVLGGSLALAGASASANPLGGVTEFSAGITAGSYPDAIAAGPDGNLWFTEPEGNRIGRITPAGVVTEFSTGITASPGAITAGPDGNLWFTEGAGRIGRITPAGVVTEYSAGITGTPEGIAAGPDGNLWFTEYEGRIGRITPAGTVTEYSAGITSGSFGIVAGPDGNLWFTEFNDGRIGRITPTGVVTEYSTGITPGSSPDAIAAGPDGNLWFTEYGTEIGRITPAGVVTEFSTGKTFEGSPSWIVAGPDGNLWFTEPEGNRIGRITPTGEVTEFSTGITPGSYPFGIAAGPKGEGNLWFTELFGNRIGRIGAVALPKFLLTVADTGAGKGTVSSEPSELGIKCEPLSKESKCTEELEETTKVKLTATPARGSKFVKWSGVACVGVEAPTTCEFEMPGKATEVKAEFAELPKLTVADTGTGNGTVSSEPSELGIKCESAVPLSKCTEGLEETTKVKLTATPAGGSKFVKWSGGPCVGSAVPTCEFEMPSKATEVTAEFAELPTVWLCQPGLANNPCESDLTTTVQLPNGSSFVKHSKPAKNPPIDCFYLYPQVSSQNTLNANLEIDPEQTQVAIDQASRFSQVCKVYAPMYPQLTVEGGLAGITPGETTIAYDGALAAWRYYLANYNHGRGFVLIGHSLGASTLKQLIKEQIDPNPALRHRLVSADLLGGQVTVPVGKDVGGDFQHVPACQAAWQTGCVVAYSSFLKEPPEPSYLGRVASPYFKTEPNPSLQILCVNPAALFPGDQSGRSEGDRSGLLLPYFSTSPFPGTLGPYWPVPKAATPWVSTPGQYSAQCKHSGGASWLQLTGVPPWPNEVQKLTVSGTSGEVVLFGPEGTCCGGAVFGFNATHEEVQTALEGPEGEYDEGRVKVFGSMFGKGNVQVTGGPGDEKGTKPYVITFTGHLAHQAVRLLETISFFGEATVVEVTHGGDPRLLATEPLGPVWGTHLVDVNIALGNLVGLTAVQARAYRAHRHDAHSG
jgi:streptogramin lyase